MPDIRAGEPEAREPEGGPLDITKAGESPGWVARQPGHSNAEMVYRRYRKFIPNLHGRDGVHAVRW
jgi:hypothetical protein